MCLILFAYKCHPKYPLIVVANRDEFYKRPTQQAHWWQDHPSILAGRDATGGGSWMGMSQDGKFAALTNYRDGFNIKENAPTRGTLVSNYLLQHTEARNYLQSIQPSAASYNGYNLLTFDGADVWYYSNISNEIIPIESGVHGLSNALLNSNWPKVNRGKNGLKALIAKETFDIDAAFEMLLNSEPAEDENLPKTGIPLEWERQLSSMCIKTKDYGTRCSTVVLWGHDGNVHFEERSYVPATGTKAFQVKIEKAAISL